MEEKIKILLDRIGLQEDHYNYFLDSKLKKIKVSRNDNSWILFIEKDTMLPLEIIKEMEEKKHNVMENLSSVEIVYEIKEKKYEYFLDYYPFVLECLKEDLRVLEIYEDALVYEDE